jgi:hypothetical protein
MEWRAYDRDDKPGTAPPIEQLVWVMEVFYTDGVTLGYFDGFTFRMWHGTDDCQVTHWAPIVTPGFPHELREAIDDD